MSLLLDFASAHKGKLITVLFLSAIAIGSTYLLGSDNPVEESAEALLKSQTGVDIDFSPK